MIRLLTQHLGTALTSCFRLIGKRNIWASALALSIVGTSLGPLAQSVDARGTSSVVRRALVVIMVEGSIIGGVGDAVTQYALDIQSSLPDTHTMIMPVGAGTSPGEISTMLERMAIEGVREGSVQLELEGIILVGQVPLPEASVPTGGITTLYPYTDFREPLFQWSERSQSFVMDPSVSIPRPEIWHGVIRPGGTTGEQIEAINLYFERNNALRQLEEDETPDVLFFADLISEGKSINPVEQVLYELRETVFVEDFGFLRFNGVLLNTITEAVAFYTEERLDLAERQTELAGVDFGRVNTDTGGIDPVPAGTVITEFTEDLRAISDPDDVEPQLRTPDSVVREQILQLLPTYTEVVRAMLDRSARLIAQTGRYNVQEGTADMLPALITDMDVRSVEYFRELTLDLEEEIIDVIRTYEEPTHLIMAALEETEPPGDNDTITRIVPNRYYGRTASAIDHAEQCSLLRGTHRGQFPLIDYPSATGGTEDGEEGEEEGVFFTQARLEAGKSGQLTQLNRLWDLQPQDDPDIYTDGCAVYAGCCIINRFDPVACIANEAVEPIFQPRGGEYFSVGEELPEYIRAGVTLAELPEEGEEEGEETPPEEVPPEGGEEADEFLEDDTAISLAPPAVQESVISAHYTECLETSFVPERVVSVERQSTRVGVLPYTKEISSIIVHDQPRIRAHTGRNVFEAIPDLNAAGERGLGTYPFYQTSSLGDNLLDRALENGLSGALPADEVRRITYQSPGLLESEYLLPSFYEMVEYFTYIEEERGIEATFAELGLDPPAILETRSPELEGLPLRIEELTDEEILILIDLWLLYEEQLLRAQAFMNQIEAYVAWDAANEEGLVQSRPMFYPTYEEGDPNAYYLRIREIQNLSREISLEDELRELRSSRHAPGVLILEDSASRAAVIEAAESTVSGGVGFEGFLALSASGEAFVEETFSVPVEELFRSNLLSRDASLSSGMGGDTEEEGELPFNGAVTGEITEENLPEFLQQRRQSGNGHFGIRTITPGTGGGGSSLGTEGEPSAMQNIIVDFVAPEIPAEGFLRQGRLAFEAPEEVRFLAQMIRWRVSNIDEKHILAMKIFLSSLTDDVFFPSRERLEEETEIPEPEEPIDPLSLETGPLFSEEELNGLIEADATGEEDAGEGGETGEEGGDGETPPEEGPPGEETPEGEGPPDEEGEGTGEGEASAENLAILQELLATLPTGWLFFGFGRSNEDETPWEQEFYDAIEYQRINGYEYASITAEGDVDAIWWSGYREPSEVDDDWANYDEEYLESLRDQIDEEGEGEGCEQYEGRPGVSILEWPAAIACWLESIAELPNNLTYVEVDGFADSTSFLAEKGLIDGVAQYNAIVGNEPFATGAMTLSVQSNLAIVGTQNNLEINLTAADGSQFVAPEEISIEVSGGATVLPPSMAAVEPWRSVVSGGHEAIPLSINESGSISITVTTPRFGSQTIVIEAAENPQLIITESGTGVPEGAIGVRIESNPPGFTGLIRLNVLGDLALGERNIINMVDGVAETFVRPLSLRGGTLIARSPGFQEARALITPDGIVSEVAGDGILTFTNLPEVINAWRPAEISVRGISPGGELVVPGGLDVTLTEDSSDMGEFQGGGGDYTFLPEGRTGVIRIVASAEGYVPIRAEIPVALLLTNEEVGEMQSNSTVVSLVGGGFGDFGQREDHIANQFLFGTPDPETDENLTVTQTVLTSMSSLLSDPVRVAVAEDGSITVFDPQVGVEVESLSPLQFRIEDQEQGTTLMRYRLAPDGPVTLSDTRSIGATSTAQVGMEIVSAYDDVLTIQNEGALVLLDAAGREQVRVNADGSVQIGRADVTVTPLSLASPSQSMQLAVQKSGATVAFISLSGFQIEPLSDVSSVIRPASVSGNPDGSRGFSIIGEGGIRAAEAFPTMPADGGLFGDVTPLWGTQEDRFAQEISSRGYIGHSALTSLGPTGVILGDPVFRFRENSTINGGFDPSTGIQINPHDTQILEDVEIGDFDADGIEDLYLLQGDSRVRILRNQGSGDYEDLGEIVEHPEDAIAIGTKDYNGDGHEGVIILDDDGLTTAFSSVQETMDISDVPPLPADSGYQELFSADFDQDGNLDALVQRNEGVLAVYWGTTTGYLSTPTVVGDLGVEVETADIAEDVLFISSEGLQGSEQIVTEVTANQEDGLSLLSESSPSGEGLEESPLTSTLGELRDTLPEILTEDVPVSLGTGNSSGVGLFSPVGNFGGVSGTVTLTDVDDGALLPGQRVTVEVNLNATSADGDLLTLALRLSPGLSFQRGSLRNGADEPFDPEFEDISIGSRTPGEVVIYQVGIGGRNPDGTGGQRTLRFDMRSTVDDAYEITVERIATPPRIIVTVPGQPGATVYTASGRSFGRNLEDDASSALPGYLAELAQSIIEARDTGVFDEDLYTSLYTQDRDRDSVPDAWDLTQGTGDPSDANDDGTYDYGGALDGIGELAGEVQSLTTCNRGCLPVPLNHAFLVPGPWNLYDSIAQSVGNLAEGIPIESVAEQLEILRKGFGVYGGVQPGIPAFGTLSVFPYVCAGTACNTPLSNFRFYLSPTLTGALGAAICRGPYAGVGGFNGNAIPNCMVFAKELPLTESCNPTLRYDDGGPRQDVGECSVALQGDGHSRARSTDLLPHVGGLRLRTEIGTFGLNYPRNTNRRILPFPVGWVYDQIAELSAMFRLPTLKIVLPDFRSEALDRYREDLQAQYGDITDRAQILFETADAQRLRAELETGPPLPEIKEVRISRNDPDAIAPTEDESAPDFGQRVYADTALFLQPISEKLQGGLSYAQDSLKEAAEVVDILEKGLSGVGEGVGYAGEKLDEVQELMIALDKLPLLEIERMPIPVKVPYISREKIHSLEKEMSRWTVRTQREVEAFLNSLACRSPGNTQEEAIQAYLDELIFINTGRVAGVSLPCAQIAADINEMLRAVNQNLEALESYIDLAGHIADLDRMIAENLGKLVQVLDLILFQYLEWYQENSATLEQWIALLYLIEEAVETWKDLLNVFVAYEQFCQACTVDKGSTLFNLFSIMVSVIIEPPIIRFPRLPDITVDASQIKGNISIPLPYIALEYEELRIPRLPNIQLPRFAGISGQIPLPEIPVLPVFELPEIDIDVPPIPQIPLPDLPPAPMIPDIPSGLTDIITALEPLLYFWCLYKTNFIYPEMDLVSPIAQITSRPGGTLLEWDLIANLSPFEDISIPSLREIRVDVKTNIDIDFDPGLTALVGTIVAPLNAQVNNLSDTVSLGIRYVFDQFGDATDLERVLPAAPIDINQFLEGDGLGSDGEAEFIEARMEMLERVRPEYRGIILAAAAAFEEQMQELYLPQDILRNRGYRPVRLPAEPDAVEEIRGLQASLQKLQRESTVRSEQLARGEIDLTNMSGVVPTGTPLLVSESIPLNPLQSENVLVAFNPTRPLSTAPFENDPADGLARFIPANGIGQDGLILSCAGENFSLIASETFARSIDQIMSSDVDDDGDIDLILRRGNGLFLKENYTEEPVEFFVPNAPLSGSVGAYTRTHGAPQIMRTDLSDIYPQLTWSGQVDENVIGIELQIYRREADIQGYYGGGPEFTALYLLPEYLPEGAPLLGDPDAEFANQSITVGGESYSGQLLIQTLRSDIIEVPIPADGFFVGAIRIMRAPENGGFSNQSWPALLFSSLIFAEFLELELLERLEPTELIFEEIEFTPQFFPVTPPAS